MTAAPALSRTARAGILVTSVLAGLAMIGPFTIDTIFPAFEAMEGQFGVGSAAMQQVTSAYLLSFAVMSVLHGPLSDALGRKPVMIAGLAGYVLATIGCALAPNLGVLIACRVAQGACAGAGTIVSRVVIRDMFSGPEAHRLMSQVMMIFSIAPAVAPVAGGLLLTWGPWPVIFWAMAVYGLVIAALTAVVLPETHPREARQPLRLGALVSALVEVGRHGPMARLAFASAFAFAAQFLYVVAAPIVVVDLLGLGERDFWVLFVPMIAGVAIGAWLSGHLAHRIERHRLVDRAMGFAVAAAVLNVTLALVAPRLPWAVIAVSLLAVAVTVSFPVLQLEILDLFPTHRGTAASVATFVALGFNAVLAGVIAPLVTESLLTMALTSIGFTVLATALWTWHRRIAARDAPVAPAVDQRA